MQNTVAPLLEVDRFYPAPPDGYPPRRDAQSEAVERLVSSCERIRPHLRDLESLERFIERLHDPARARRRISLALAILVPDTNLLYGQVGRTELETFRALAQGKLGAVIWVFT